MVRTMRLMPPHLEHLTLRELVDVTGELLAGMRVEQRDGRATAFPDSRAVRYYISLGLVDRPLGYRGTSALYGERHVLQLLATKVLQSGGRSLPAIQQQLLGRDDRALAALLPPVVPIAQARTAGAPAVVSSDATVLISVPVRPGVTVLLDPGTLGDANALRGLADEVLAALRRAAKSLSTVPVPSPTPDSPSPEKE